MARTKQIRWECPNGLHPGKLASSRPRANATVRYCLPCSEEAGVLVERVAPALERKRRVKAEAKRERKVTAKDRAAESLAERAKVPCVDEAGREVVVDVLAEVKACAALLGIREPTVKLTRREERRGASSGRGDPWKHSVSFVVWGAPVSAEQLRALVLHECCHVAETSRMKQGRARWHGPKFKRKLLDAARERWPQIAGLTDDRLVRSPKAYDLDENIVDALKACTLLDAETARLAA